MILSSGVLCSKAQDTSAIYDFLRFQNISGFKNNISIKSDFELGSKGFSNQTLLKFNNKLYIDEEYKKNLIKQLFNSNTIGYDFTTLIRYSFRSKANRYVWIEAGARSNMNATLKKPLLQLALNGNSHYAGQNIDLEGNRYRSISWQYVSAGITLIKKKYIASGGLGFVAGKYHTALNVYSGNIYTDKDGEYINLRLDAEANRSKPIANTLFKLGGAGAAANLDVYIPRKNHLFQFGFRDLGLVRWVNNAVYTRVDTSIHFEGIIINDFNMITNKAARQRLEDSLKQIPGSFSENKSYTSLLPAYIYAKYIRNWGKDLVSVSAEYIYTAYPLPKVSFTYYRIKKQHSVNTQITLGGFNYYDVNAGYTLSLNKFKLDFMLRSIRGLIAPKVFSGAGIYINLSKNL